MPSLLFSYDTGRVRFFALGPSGCQSRDVGPGGLDGGQGVQGLRLVEQLDVGVAIEAEHRRGVSGQFLDHLDVLAAGHKAADVGIPQGVKIGHTAADATRHFACRLSRIWFTRSLFLRAAR